LRQINGITDYYSVSFFSNFGRGGMTRKNKIPDPSGYVILLVDDSLEYRESACSLLEREGHTILTAENGPDTLSILKNQKVDLLLLDYYMPDMTGEEVVLKLREFNPIVQIILQTGYSSEQPARELLRRLDIQGYYDKSEGPEKLLLWADVGLKAAYNIQLLTKSRQGLQYILSVTPEMHKIQPLTDLLQGILLQVTGLLGVVNSFLAVMNDGGIRRPQKDEAEGFLAIINEDTDLAIRASTGRFTSQIKINEAVKPEQMRIIQEVLNLGKIKLLADTTLIPLKVGETTIGIIYLDRQVVQPQDLELLSVFANQAAVAIQNSQLYMMAAIDKLTGLYVRGFFENWFQRELRTAFRSQQALSLLMIDVDKLKRINDLAGHLAGDEALVAVGRILAQATRNTDIVGRYGGDEFIILLPQTSLQGAELVGKRIISLFDGKTIPFSEGTLALHGSLGLCTLEPHKLTPEDIPHPVPQEYFENTGILLIKSADKALYESKKEGGGQLRSSPSVQWPPFAR
jgi:diguanylate cyclase (GGDEF)-like protein